MATIDGSNDTLNALDSINGGKGTNSMTLNLVGGNTLPAGITMTNVQTINVRGSAAVTLDLTDADAAGITGVTTLNSTQSTTATLTAANTTDVNVSGAAGAIAVDGGKNVVVNDAAADTDITIGANAVNKGTITVTDTNLGKGIIAIDGGTDVTVTASGVKFAVTGAINIGQGGAATDLPTGAVVVSSTGAAYDPAAHLTLSNITIDGGKTISVTQVATSDASKAASDTSAQIITQGNITITAAATTTDVTVKQTAAQAANSAANSTGGVTETASVKFVNLLATKTVTINGLTLTAVEDMSATQVAAAFANLAANAVIPSDASLVAADGDTQSSAAAAKATYSGSISGWTSGAATGDTVVFTYATANAAPGGSALAVTGSGTAITPTVLTTGKANDATPIGGVAQIVAGDVDITGGAALATVTVDGYGSATASQIQGTTNTALATINLSNGANFYIESAATALALNLTNVSGNVNVDAGTTTLNAIVTGATTATLVSDTATKVNVSGTGKVEGTTATGLTAATAINTTGMTAGTATFTIDSTATTYTGGAGVDKVTFSNSTAATKALDLGAGNDTLVFAGTTLPTTETFKGGADNDTVSLTTAQAANSALSANALFAAKLDSFERLLISDAAGNTTVDLANLGFTNYVTATGSTGTLTLDKLATEGTVIVTAANTTGLTVNVKDAGTNLTDVLNLTLSKTTTLAAGTLTANGVETVNLTVTDSNTTDNGGAIAVHTLTFTDDKATTLDIGGNAGLTLTLGATTVKLATVDGGDMTGALTASANGEVAMTIKGGSGADVLAASIGATAEADTINGGGGNDTLVAGANGAQLIGGAGNDLFILGNAAGTAGTKAANTYSTITDFGVGDDALQLVAYNTAGTADLTAVTFTKLQANVQDPVNPQSYMEAVMDQLATAATLGTAVWFMHGSDTYVVVDSGAVATAGDVFAPSDDLIIKLTGVNGNNLSFNSDFGTVAL